MEHELHSIISTHKIFGIIDFPLLIIPYWNDRLWRKISVNKHIRQFISPNKIWTDNQIQMIMYMLFSTKYDYSHIFYKFPRDMEIIISKNPQHSNFGCDIDFIRNGMNIASLQYGIYDEIIDRIKRAKFSDEPDCWRWKRNS